MKNKPIFFNIIFLFVFSCLYSQQEKMTAMQVLKKANEIYDKKEYVTYASKYSLYLDYTTQKAHEQYNGFVLKKNNVNYFKIKNTEFVLFNNYGVKINHEEKAIIIEKGADNTIQDSPLSLASYLKGFESKLIPNKDYFICELSPPKISQIMLHKVLIYIKKSDYSIVKQSLFFVEKMESTNAKGKTIYTVPRLEVAFSPRIKNEKNDDLLVKRANYFIEKDNKIIVSKRLSAYKLL